VEAALTWIGARSDADAKRIGIVGADIGANIAYVSSGSFPGVKAAVSISPEYRIGQQVLVGMGIPNFRPRAVLYLAAFGDGYAFSSAQTMSEKTQPPTLAIGYQGTAHGFDLLQEEEVRAEILQWLRNNL